MKTLKKMIGDACPDEEKITEFDREFLDGPREVIETRTERYIFTEHYLMYLYKGIWEMYRSRLLCYSEVDRMNAVSHIGGGGDVYKCVFYGKGKKQPLLQVRFSKGITGKEFMEKLNKMMPGVAAEKWR